MKIRFLQKIVKNEQFQLITERKQRAVQPLADEIDGLIERLKVFSDTICGGDRAALFDMLHAGRERKELLNAREQERTAP